MKNLLRLYRIVHGKFLNSALTSSMELLSMLLKIIQSHQAQSWSLGTFPILQFRNLLTISVIKLLGFLNML